MSGSDFLVFVTVGIIAVAIGFIASSLVINAKKKKNGTKKDDRRNK